MTSSWALPRFGGLTGGLSRRITHVMAAARRRTAARRKVAPTTADVQRDNRRRALRHVVTFTGNSNQNLLDVRWGEPVTIDDRQ